MAMSCVRKFVLALTLIALSSAQEFDTRCWLHAAQADPERCSLEHACHSDCWSSIFTHSYCCVENSPCWWWGRDATGDVVRSDVARSGVECRFLCQAEPLCAAWTFQMPPQQDATASGPCMLRSGTRGGSAPGMGDRAVGVVSGPRICSSPGGSAPRAAMDTLQSAASEAYVFKASDPAHAQKAARALQTEGWAVIRQAIGDGEVSALFQAATAAAEQILLRDPSHLGNRGPRRYSFGGASKTHHMVHIEAWAHLLDNPILRSVLNLAFGGPYVSVGGGGDFVLGLTDTHQRLHIDLQRAEMYDVHFPPAAIVANVAVTDVGCTDGPMRVVPRTQLLPLLAAEQATQGEDLMLNSSLEKEGTIQDRLGVKALLTCPLARGDMLLRDMRLWHGGTPNEGENMRLFPSAEFLSPWYAELTRGTDDHFAPRPALPFRWWSRMSDEARTAAREVLSAPEAVDHGWRTDFILLLPYVAEDRP